jgi:hypothetical protein
MLPCEVIVDTFGSINKTWDLMANSTYCIHLTQKSTILTCFGGTFASIRGQYRTILTQCGVSIHTDCIFEVYIAVTNVTL